MQHCETNFQNREERAGFIAKTFKRELASAANVLDVGCDYNSLKNILGNKTTGIDLYGEPDIVIDFEKEKLSRFKTSEFDFVVCTEVLEHLDNLHEMVDEIFRVSNRYVLISLPNCLSIFTKWNVVVNDSAGKFYGLPFTRPEDRHRWFFSYKDINRFFENYSKLTGWKIKSRFLTINFSDSWKGKLIKFIVRIIKLNSASQSFWILMEKPKTQSKRNLKEPKKNVTKR